MSKKASSKLKKNWKGNILIVKFSTFNFKGTISIKDLMDIIILIFIRDNEVERFGSECVVPYWFSQVAFVYLFQVSDISVKFNTST